MRLAVLAAVAQTGRNEREHIARASAADPATALAELAERDMIAFGHAGDMRAATQEARCWAKSAADWRPWIKRA